MDAKVEPVESSDPLVMEVDFLCSRPAIDTSRIGVWGFSQGGGLSLATATLDRRISFEKVRSLKSIIVYPDLEHEYRTDITNHAKAWMDRYLR